MNASNADNSDESENNLAKISVDQTGNQEDAGQNFAQLEEAVPGEGPRFRFNRYPVPSSASATPPGRVSEAIKESRELEQRHLEAESDASTESDCTDQESCDDSDGFHCGRKSRRVRSTILASFQAEKMPDCDFRDLPNFPVARWQIVALYETVVFDTMDKTNNLSLERFTGGKMIAPALECCQFGEGWILEASGLTLFLQLEMIPVFGGRFEPNWHIYTVNHDADAECSRKFLQTLVGNCLEQRGFTSFEAPLITPTDICFDATEARYRGWKVDALGIVFYLRLAFYLPEGSDDSEPGSSQSVSCQTPSATGGEMNNSPVGRARPKPTLPKLPTFSSPYLQGPGSPYLQRPDSQDALDSIRADPAAQSANKGLEANPA